MITIELTNKEAELFKTFRQYQDYWERIFKTREGSVKLNFNKQGRIGSVDYYGHEEVVKKDIHS